MSQVVAGDVVRIHYTGRLAKGEVFDSSRGGDPLEFTAASDELIAGVSKAVVGMTAGEKKTVNVPPDQGYGERNPDLVIQVPSKSLPEDARVGVQLGAKLGEHVVPVLVTEIGDEFATVDANPPLAGYVLEFDIELVWIRPRE